MKWTTIRGTSNASRGIWDYRVHWNGVQGAWEACSSFELHGAMTPWSTLGFRRTPEAAMALCEEHGVPRP